MNARHTPLIIPGLSGTCGRGGKIAAAIATTSCSIVGIASVAA
jgi:hypothetical protein